MTEIVTLSKEEVKSAIAEGQDPKKILEVKSEWYKALEELEKSLGTRLNDEITYEPSLLKHQFEPLSAPISSISATAEGKMFFSTPNKEVNFDCHPTFKSKLASIAHEKFGHPADQKEYYGEDIYGCERELGFYLTPEQRVNLRVAHLLPGELYEGKSELIKSQLRRLGEDHSKLGKYDMPIFAIETLGRMGMKRNDDIVELYKKVKEDTGLSMDNLVRRFFTFSFAGLVASPSMNGDKKYGIRAIVDLNGITNYISLYIRGLVNRSKVSECLEYFGYKTKTDDDYKPEYSVGMTWIQNPRIALKNLYNAISYWEWVARHNNTYRAPEDMVNALKSIAVKIEGNI
jgi:hypothetical protein